jgi:hypothetical protein
MEVHRGALLQVPKKKLSASPEELQKTFSTQSSAVEVAPNAMTPDFVAP